MSRLVCWFSCGAASAVATKLAITKNAGKLPVVIARCIVREEHSDNDRFAADCEKWFGLPITNLIAEEYNGSIYNVFQKRKYISGVAGAPCTMLLKKQVRLDFELPTDRHVFGYCAEEQDRWDRFLDANNIDAHSPLIDRGLEHSDCLAMVEKAGIELPTMYKLGYKHNNCIGCCKATGAGYWNKIRNDFPNSFERMASVSLLLGARMVKVDGERTFLHLLPEGTGDYQSEPEIQCGIFCEMANNELESA
jgi:hypothetical protein